MSKIRSIICVLCCAGLFFACSGSGQKNPNVSGQSPEQKNDDTAILLTEDVLSAESRRDYDGGDELFEDFLYNYVHDSVLRMERTEFPLVHITSDGNAVKISKDEWHDAFSFLNGEYTTMFYADGDDGRFLNEDTTLTHAVVERIDLDRKHIVAYEFLKEKFRWKLRTLRDMSFAESDMSDFLSFYSAFAKDSIFQSKSMSRSIRISMMDPNDDSQVIEGFINREQWMSLSSGMPAGVVSNIRYGQDYSPARRIRIEKVSLGNGMAETFFFAKRNGRWEMVGYEN